MKAKYFDGKSSKAHEVEVQKIGDDIRILFVDGSNVFWKGIDTSVDSMSSSEKYLISYGDFPQQRLELMGSEAKVFLDIANKNNRIASLYQLALSMSTPKMLIIGLCILSVTIWSYISWVSPFIGERVAQMMPIEAEIAMGDRLYSSISTTIDIDTTKSALLMDFYNECGFQSAYPISIEYADEDVINAFAVPGGRILIYGGIIEEMESWEELAALMGHELAHVNERHSFIQLARTLSGYLIISALTGDIGGVSAIIIENVNQIYQLSFSRNHETEADEIGMSYLKELKIRPDAMVDLFSRLESGGIGGQLAKSMEYLSTHPITGDRMKHLLEIITEDESFQYDQVDNPRAKEIWEQLQNSDDPLEEEEEEEEMN